MATAPVRKHEFPDASDETTCIHCGDTQKLAKSGRSCIGREVPRATPPSIFTGDITHIGERAQAICKDEGLMPSWIIKKEE